ncbi:MAG: glucan 1,4-alpha-glucosidase, partial [Chloroflexia bacterium]
MPTPRPPKIGINTRPASLLACCVLLAGLLTACLGPDATPTPPPPSPTPATGSAPTVPTATSTSTSASTSAGATATVPEVAASPSGATTATGAAPPGWPGDSAFWTTGNKQGLGTSTTPDSKVWYTLANGVLSEVYYPRGDTADVRSLEFAVTDGTSFVDRESDDTTHEMRLTDPRSLTYEQTNKAKSGRYRITKTYVTDPVRSTLLIQVAFEPLQPGPYQLFMLYDPALGNSSLHDTASRRGSGTGVALLAADGPIAGALVSSSGFLHTSSGFVGTSDGWTDLKADRHLDWSYDTAADGNVLQVAEILLDPSGKAATFTLALGFAGSTADAEAATRASLAQPFSAHLTAYQSGWHDYLASLTPAPAALKDRLAVQYDVAVMTIKAHEDKSFPGAFIASLTLPWGFNVKADDGGGGYHFVWARDLYHQVTAMLAAGDRTAADRAVTWLFTHQQLLDGTFPQNSKVNGTPDQTNVQLDETAFPIVLAWQLGRTDDPTWQGVIKAADALVLRGPSTPQERWEETDGYSPSTLAAEIAGLVAAGDLARSRGDTARAALWTGVADAWQRSTEKWMFTTTGPEGDGHYYVRIDNNGDPNDGSARDYANGAGFHKENSILDAGFLELVRMGVKAPNDKYVADSLPETDASLAVDTPSGRVWHRYTLDGYGEKPTGGPWEFNTITMGRPWPILSGERGEYEVANGRDGLPFLRTMANTANDGYMIPEQVWDRPDPTTYGYQLGKATGSASPLAWAMAQYIRLARAIELGHPPETPEVVARRYAGSTKLSQPALELTAPPAGAAAGGPNITVRGTTNAEHVYVATGGEVKTVAPTGGAFEVAVPLQSGGNLITVVAQSSDGGTNMRQVTT